MSERETLDGSPGCVVDPHVRTDRSVDFRTVDRVLDSLIDGGLSVEEKVLAVFHAIRRVFVHGPTPSSMAFDFHRVMHVLGTGVCLRMTTPLHVLYERMGFESQSWVHNGHHMMQVRYGGDRHCLDPHMSFTCYDRSSPPKIASIEQLQDDPALARDAVAEGRAGAGYLLCGDSPDWFAGREGEWYPEADGSWPEMTIDEPFGGITLRPGETFIRTWHPGEHFYRAGWLERDGTGPIHHCAEADRLDSANWPLYEPYGWQGRPGSDRTHYRAWGVGRLEYCPRFSDGTFREGLKGEVNTAVGADGTLQQADGNSSAEVVFAVSCPYVLTAVELEVVTEHDGIVQAWIRTLDAPEDGDGVSPLAYDETKVRLQPQGQRRTARLVDEVNGCFDGYTLRLRLEGGAKVESLSLVSHFQLNRYALPFLVSGRNVVSVEAVAYGAQLTVRYEWAEGQEWRTPRSEERRFTQNGSFDVDVEGPKSPRMEALILSLA